MSWVEGCSSGSSTKSVVPQFVYECVTLSILTALSCLFHLITSHSLLIICLSLPPSLVALVRLNISVIVMGLIGNKGSWKKRGWWGGRRQIDYECVGQLQLVQVKMYLKIRIFFISEQGSIKV